MEVESNSQKRPFSWGKIEIHFPALLIPNGAHRKAVVGERPRGTTYHSRPHPGSSRSGKDRVPLEVTFLTMTQTELL